MLQDLGKPLYIHSKISTGRNTSVYGTVYGRAPRGAWCSATFWEATVTRDAQYVQVTVYAGGVLYSLIVRV